MRLVSGRDAIQVAACKAADRDAGAYQLLTDEERLTRIAEVLGELAFDLRCPSQRDRGRVLVQLIAEGQLWSECLAWDHAA